MFQMHVSRPDVAARIKGEFVMSSGISKRLVIGFAVAGALGLTASARASLLWSDNFDSSTSLSTAWSPYTNSGTNGSVTVVNTPYTAPSSPNYASLYSIVGNQVSLPTSLGANAPFAAQSTLYMGAWINLEPISPSATANQVMGLYDAYGKLPVLISLTGGTGSVYNLATSVNGGTTTLATGLSRGTWYHLMFGVTMDTGTVTVGDGSYSLYLDTGSGFTALASGVAITTPYSSGVSDNLASVRFQTYRAGQTLDVDSVQVFNSDPLVPEPTSLGLLSLGGLLMLRKRGA